MRLLVFSITFRPFIGGAEIALEEILKRVKNVEASVITARLDKTLPKKEVFNGITIHRVGRGIKLDKYTYLFNACRLAKRLHKKEPFDVSQAMMANYAGMAALLFKMKFPKVKYLLTLQSGDSSFFIWIRTFWFYPFYKRVYTKADYIQSISKYLMHRAKKYGFSGRGSIVPNGVDVAHYAHKKSSEEIAALRIELGIAQDEKVIVTTSRLVYKNAVDQLILGFNEWASKANIPAKLLIIGGGKDEGKLRKLAKDIDIEERIIFAGEKPHDALPLYLQASDAFVRPSRSEGMGNSFIEAMAAGIPVVGTKVGGIVDFLENKKTGMLIDRDNPYAIARALHELVTNEALRTEIVENGRRMVSERYEWNNVAEQMQDIYNKLSNA